MSYVDTVDCSGCAGFGEICGLECPECGGCGGYEVQFDLSGAVFVKPLDSSARLWYCRDSLKAKIKELEQWQAKSSPILETSKK